MLPDINLDCQNERIFRTLLFLSRLLVCYCFPFTFQFFLWIFYLSGLLWIYRSVSSSTFLHIVFTTVMLSAHFNVTTPSEEISEKKPMKIMFQHHFLQDQKSTLFCSQCIEVMHALNLNTCTQIMIKNRSIPSTQSTCSLLKNYVHCTLLKRIYHRMECLKMFTLAFPAMMFLFLKFCLVFAEFLIFFSNKA